ncbi:hypothetical protein A2U01_0080280, partial [Trifolium medium]|nr:hypothetical protein [Trifolium medium]
MSQMNSEQYREEKRRAITTKNK